MSTPRFLRTFVALIFATAILGTTAEIKLNLQQRTANGDAFKLATQAEQWSPKETALIVCDMWNLHPCLNAWRRGNEMAPRVNAVLDNVRKQGVFIIHAPSSCMKFYEAHPARARALAAPKAATLPADIGTWCKQIPAEEKGKYPIDQTDGGVDDDPAEHAKWIEEIKAQGANPGAPWTRQMASLTIDGARDAISDSGVEVWNMLEARGIKNVILLGVHVNMCVSGRPFGLRQMAKNGKHVVLMRDLTDSMYNPARWPHVDHFTGTALYIEHVEKYICPTITSDQILGGQPFVFKGVPAKGTSKAP